VLLPVEPLALASKWEQYPSEHDDSLPLSLHSDSSAFGFLAAAARHC
jgi:hypothetical protein